MSTTNVDNWPITVKSSSFGDYFDFGLHGTMIVATSGPQGYRPFRLLLAHQLYVKDVPKLLAEHPGQTGLVVVPVDDKAWMEVPPVPPVAPTWAHTAQSDPAGLYDDNWEPRNDPLTVDELARAMRDEHLLPDGVNPWSAAQAVLNTLAARKVGPGMSEEGTP